MIFCGGFIQIESHISDGDFINMELQRSRYRSITTLPVMNIPFVIRVPEPGMRLPVLRWIRTALDCENSLTPQVKAPAPFSHFCKS